MEEKVTSYKSFDNILSKAICASECVYCHNLWQAVVIYSVHKLSE